MKKGLITACFLLLTIPCLAQLELSIDHVPVVVQNLDSARTSFEEAGFTVKPGFPHANGLNNAHIEFSDGTELELMSLQNPTDSIALAYSKFLESGEGGTYLALSTYSLGLLKQQLISQSVPFDTLSTPGFNYITFSQKGLKHIFFVDYSLPNLNDTTSSSHQINTAGIKSVTITGNYRTIDFFRKMGLDVSIRSAREYQVNLSAQDSITIILDEYPLMFRVTDISLSEDPDMDIYLHGLRIQY